MWSKGLCVVGGVLMLLAFGMGCEEEVKKEAAPPTVEKAKPVQEPKPAARLPAPAPAPKTEAEKPAPSPATKPEVKEPAPAPAKKAAVPAPAAKAGVKEPAAAPSAKAEAKEPAKKTEITVAEVTAPAPEKAAKPAPAKKEAETAKPAEPAEPEKKVTPPRPKAPAVGPFSAQEEAWKVDDFEAGTHHWVVETWANPAELSVVNGELKIQLQEGESDKTAIFRPASFNMSDRTKAVLSVRNGTGKEIQVAVAFTTGGSQTYFESEAVKVKPGLNQNVAFDLNSDKFKSEGSDWKHTAKVAEPEIVKRLIILIYAEGKGDVCLDNIRIEK